MNITQKYMGRKAIGKEKKLAADLKLHTEYFKQIRSKLYLCVQSWWFNVSMLNYHNCVYTG